jgi:2-polyprenyl-3-methyl-5-hydroxy-6-metoxy-1,4-benzoquinol methylase
MDMKTIKSQLIDKCLITGAPVTKILDLGMHPYADTFISKDQLNLSEPVFPLQVAINPESGQVQLRYISNDNDRYNLYDYSYTSANSNFSKKHWDNYFKTIKRKFSLKGSSVLEIGSNDGYLAEKFTKDCRYVLGIDSSRVMCQVAIERGVNTMNNLFNYELALSLKKERLFDVIIANNVFNHANNPIDFAQGVSTLLSDKGVFVFELPYWGSTIKSGKFDQIYHEHVSYFTLKSSKTLLSKVGLKVVDCELVDYHGGSIRIYAQRDGDVSSRVYDFEKMENSLNLFDIETYESFQKNIVHKRNILLKKIIKLKASGASIVGIGAAAKANTFLNFYNLDASLLDYVTDSSEFKQQKFTPLTRIPIVGDEIFKKYEDVYALILSWNISSLLKKKLLKVNPKIKFISL